MHDSRAGLLSAIPDIGFGAVFLITWIRPATFDPFMVRWLLIVMLVEFVIIHSAAFMGIVAFAPAGTARRLGGIAGLGAFYTLFAGAFALVFRSWWPLAAFWGQTVNRMLGVILGQGQDLGQKVMVAAGWAASTLFYIVACLATIPLPIPPLGITPDVVAAQHIPGSGLWVEHPEKVIAAGVLYFGLTACWELSAHRWAAKARGAAKAFTPPSLRPRA